MCSLIHNTPIALAFYWGFLRAVGEEFNADEIAALFDPSEAPKFERLHAHAAAHLVDRSTFLAYPNGALDTPIAVSEEEAKRIVVHNHLRAGEEHAEGLARAIEATFHAAGGPEGLTAEELARLTVLLNLFTKRETP